MATVTAETITQEQGLQPRQILRFYLPLAISWICMALESPVAIYIISHLANPQINTAAFAIMMSLSLWIESPVIDLLSTSTTLSKNHRDYLTLRRFVFYLLFWVTAVHFLVAWTPLYWFVTHNLMGAPIEAASAARLGFCLMVPWSALIGWRRFHQGILIRFGKTKRVGAGTFVRVSTMAGVGLLLYLTTHLPSMSIAGIALISSVATESVYVHLAARGVIKSQLSSHEASGPPLTLKKLLSFHMPLTATTAVMMLGAPVVISALAHAANPVLTIAGYQLAQSVLWLHRTVVFALPEVVITLYKDAQSALALKKFSVGVGIITSCLLTVVGVLHVDMFIFLHVLGAKLDVARVAHQAFLAGALLPFLGALQSYVRGMLAAHHLTIARFAAVIASMLVLAILLTITVKLGIAGVVSAALALTLTLIAELGVLVYYYRRGTRNLASSPL